MAEAILARRRPRARDGPRPLRPAADGERRVRRPLQRGPGPHPPRSVRGAAEPRGSPRPRPGLRPRRTPRWPSSGTSSVPTSTSPCHCGTAHRAAAARGTVRERAFVASIQRRVAGDSSALLQYVADYPLDVLALSIAIPTIAFSGAYDVPEEAWACLDSVARHYGDDWWFTGLLAFARQDQRRFAEAERLAEHSLALRAPRWDRGARPDARLLRDRRARGRPALARPVDRHQRARRHAPGALLLARGAPRAGPRRHAGRARADTSASSLRPPSWARARSSTPRPCSGGARSRTWTSSCRASNRCCRRPVPSCARPAPRSPPCTQRSPGQPQARTDELGDLGRRCLGAD